MQYGNMNKEMHDQERKKEDSEFFMMMVELAPVMKEVGGGKWKGEAKSDHGCYEHLLIWRRGVALAFKEDITALV
jgi:hypothetical protein